MNFRFVLDKLLNNNKTKNNFPKGKWNSESTAAVIHDLKCRFQQQQPKNLKDKKKLERVWPILRKWKPSNPFLGRGSREMAIDVDTEILYLYTHYSMIYNCPKLGKVQVKWSSSVMSNSFWLHGL